MKILKYLMLFLVLTEECIKASKSERSSPTTEVMGPVQMLEYEATTNSIFLNWKPPNDTKEYKLIYIIKLQSFGKKFRFCYSSTKLEQRSSTNFTHQQLDSLNSFQRYRVTIQAEDVDNNQTKSEQVSKTMVTKGFEILRNEELNKVSIYIKEIFFQTLTFRISSLDCRRLRGELRLKLVFSCEGEKFCSKEIFRDFSSLTFFYTYSWNPFVWYKYEASLCRHERCKKIGNGRFKVNSTDIDAPQNLRVEWFKNSTIVLFWTFHQEVKTNFSFQITISKRHTDFGTSNYSVQSGNNNIWSFFYKVPEIFPSEIYLDIQIAALGLTYRNLTAITETSSYPPVPNWVDFNTISLERGSTTVTITVKVTKRREDMSLSSRSLFILMKNEEINETDKINLRKLEEYLDIRLNMQTQVVAKIDLSENDNGQVRYSIGNETSNQLYSNFHNLKYRNINDRALKTDRNYIVTLLLVNEFNDKYCTREHLVHISAYSSDEIKKGGAYVIPIYTVLYVLLILSICLVLMVGGVIAYRKRAHRISISVNRNLYVNARGSFLSGLNYEATAKERFEHGSPTNVSSTYPAYSEEVSVANFEKYVKTSILTGELERQYNLLSPDRAEYSEDQSAVMNETNNIYLDLVAYDHARVKLKQLPKNKQYSDINASYIDGHKTSRAYIATENPKTQNFELFWRMVWEANVKHIFMLTNIHGEKKNEVDKFWPNTHEELIFQDISVKNLETTVSADFELRTLSVTKNNEQRKVKKILFTNWPYNDVPLYPQSLIPCVTEILNIPLSSSYPIVIQCSNGIGKTGTILLIDICLRIAAEKGVVDILSNFQILRNQKPNMVDNVKQYKLVHLVVLQLLIGIRTSIPCSHMNEMAVKIINKEEYRTQMDYLRRIEWQNQAMEMTPEYTEIFVNYPEKNRVANIFPGDFGRVVLERYPEDDMSSSYINAVQVDGYRCLGRYIVTQQPMPNTVGDFWRLVIQEHIKVIISLNEVDIEDETCCEFLPNADDSILCPVRYILVLFKEVVKMQNYNIHYLQVEDRNKKETIDVEVLEFKNWPARNPVPSSCEEFLSFWEEASTMSKRSRPILVTCFDGATASGVFVASSFIIEKMKVEQICDVCQGVQTVRHNRKQFVTEESQFVFLFIAAIRFINGFQFYSNFQKK